MATTTSASITKVPAKGIRVKKISPFLWFDHELEDAMNFYVSTFDNSRVLEVSRDPVGVGGAKGRVFTATFELAGQEFMGLNAGPDFKFNEAISFFVSCDTQEQVDALWERLTGDGGEESQCGWLKDKFGLSWQVVPSELPQLMTGGDGASLDRMMTAIMSMKKFDLETLRRARAG